MTLEEWQSIKTGQIIYAISNGQPRIVVRGIHNNCITLQAIRKTKYGEPTTVYDKSSRYLFSLTSEHYTQGQK